MAKPAISILQLSGTLTISERHASGEHPHGFWLWDETRGMNLAMGAATQDDALLEALRYYQNRLLQVEKEQNELQAKVDSFLVQFKTDDVESI